MKRVLLTGMSGTGKSTIVAELAARGFMAVDTDQGWSHIASDGEWLWIESRIEELLATECADVLFIGGTAANQVRFYRRFDYIILLSAQADVIAQRLATRPNNPFGKQPDELARVLDNLAVIEPMLRRAATHEIVTSRALEEVVGEIVRLVET